MAPPTYRVEAMFSRDLRDAVARGEITVSIRLWGRPHVKVGGRYPVADLVIELPDRVSRRGATAV
jgi:hypothetical protein